MSSLKKYRAEVYALIAYLVLALILTYPLILNVATHVPGDGSDDPALAWNLWWIPFSLINLGQSPIYTDYMFYPIGLNLAFYTLTYLNAFLSIPFQSAFNVIVAANVNVWLSFALSGFGVYLLMKYLFQVSSFRFQVDQLENLAAFAAGALYAFSSNKFLYASLGQFNIASSHWIPFYILFLLKTTNASNTQPATRNLFYGFLLGLFLLFQALSEFIFASFLIIFTALYLVYWLIIHRFRPPSFVLRLSSFLVAAFVFIFAMSPILAAMIQDMLTEGDFIQSGLGFADVFSSDALGFFVPSHLHPILGNLEAQFHFAYTNFAYLGFVALALAMMALITVPRARIWGIFGIIFISISLGPNLTINGTRFDLPMPFDLLLEIPFVKGNRYPSRWSVMVTLALAVLVGYGLVWLFDQVGRWQKAVGRKRFLLTAYCLLLTLLLFEHFSAPLPLSNLTVPDAYQTIAQDKGDFTVLEIPLAWRNGFRMTGTLDQAMMFAQFYQTAHRHPILGGNTSRNPELKFQYFTEAPVINSMIAIETGHKLDNATIQRDRELAPDVLRFFGVRYIVWHSPRNPENRAKLDAARAYVQYVLPVSKISEVSDDTGETVVFRVNDLPPLNQTMIRPNDFLARLNFAEGWSARGGDQVWATRHEARIFVRMDSPRDATLGLRAFAPMANQQLVFQVNQQAVCTLAMQQTWSEYPCSVKRNVWRAGLNEIVLRFDSLAPVASVHEGDFAIGKTSTQSPASIVAYSAGSEVGDFAHIFVNGIDAAQNKRGYNIVVLDQATGKIEASEVFDTFASTEESARLAQFIDKIPNGKIVAVAVRDEASRNLTQDAIEALRSLGTRGDLLGRWRWSHAIIGVKGALPARASDAAYEIAPAQIVVGVGAMEPNVAAAIEWIKIE
jgi:hypothetical protein